MLCSFQPNHKGGKGPPSEGPGEPGQAAENTEHVWERGAVVSVGCAVL